jgi:hypothetical protein
MIFQTIIIVGIMLAILVLNSTLGGSMNIKEHFDETAAADGGASPSGLKGEIIRAAKDKMMEADAQADSDAPRERQQPKQPQKPQREQEQEQEQREREQPREQPRELPQNDPDPDSAPRGDKDYGSGKDAYEPFDGEMFAAY